jgi:hypothetical protein
LDFVDNSRAREKVEKLDFKCGGLRTTFKNTFAIARIPRHFKTTKSTTGCSKAKCAKK